MDVARYKIFHGTKSYGSNYHAFRNLNMRNLEFDVDNDVNSLDSKLRSEGRYWSAKYAALEHHKNFKRLRIVAPKDSAPEIATDFIPISEETVDDEPKDSSLVEESWEDEVLRKTKEFNKMTREQPHNEKFWLEFANFQDKVESRQAQRGARLQTLEKKISILEKATELNPDNEELILALMNAYHRRDNIDVLIGRWEKLLTQNSGSYNLWREFLRLVQGEFSKFKVSEVRKMFANAIQALSAACSKLHRQPRTRKRTRTTTITAAAKEPVRIGRIVRFFGCRNEKGQEPENEQEQQPSQQQQKSQYELVESSDFSDVETKRGRRDRRKRKKGGGGDDDSRKQNTEKWANEVGSGVGTGASKEYYFDSRGDRDNLAFGSLYRMDVARYKIFHGIKSYGSNYHAFRNLNMRNLEFDVDNDVNSLDSKLRSEGRYWSAKYAALEHHKNFKRLRIVAPKDSAPEIATDFIPISEETVDDEPKDSSLVEESWEDEVLRKTKEFNKMTREQPHNEKFWLEFANFQDKVESRQAQRGARLQTLEKKISILEKATELNPDNEELILALMNAYHRRDNIDVLIGRWEKLLAQNSGSYNLWREFLWLVQGEFSKFKVSEVRKMFANAIQALSAACSKLHRQARQNDKPSADPILVQQELGLVNIFVSLCRFEWQTGYQELATALFQAQIEYSLFCPSLLLSDQGKHRLFEYFWNSSGARIGEEGALGWSNWLEKEEEQRQKAMMKESSTTVDEEGGGWSGWHEPKGESVADQHQDNLGVDDEEDDTEALMKLLGINAENEANGEVQDVSTWVRWSEEEVSRDSDQWMPIRTQGAFFPFAQLHFLIIVCDGGNSLTDGVMDKEGDDQLLRAVLFEDISEYLFSITTEEVRLSLVYQFIEFFGGRIPQWSSTNNSSWAEGTLMMESPPFLMLDDLRKVEEMLRKTDGCQNSYSLEHVLSSFDNINLRSELMKFVRNVTLQCLNAFPHDYILKEVALVAEELSKTRMNSCSLVITPCRPLAKSLIKSNRQFSVFFTLLAQDVHLCGVYARREAAFGNIEYARKAFDMALLSIEGLPWDAKSNASLLFLWYAEVELADTSSGGSESSARALHILSCLGCGIKYSPFKSGPSSLQLLRARQGFKEQVRIIQATWRRGTIDDNSIASICCAALFEEMTTGWEAGIEVLNEALSTVLPGDASIYYMLSPGIAI
ncbi:hypothetical protein CTI12_AA173800 [Artemisia annua]|uniref:Uncharacterized protein n=1 Tax=Artemisia annua TaxID=35608 RepID=A0A2U1MRZ9_ARTAN|nr:hypothetical protein CTI12_AA173800 [Artemisia annua]